MENEYWKDIKKDLLICIAYHHSEERLKYLKVLLDNFSNNYKCSFDVIIDTNESFFVDWNFHFVQVYVNRDLIHPFHLAWQHRKHMKENIDNYENFLYIENDILLPYENYLNYLENFNLL